MTDDETRPIETPAPVDPPAGPPPVTAAYATNTAGAPAAAPVVVPVSGPGSNRARWVAALGVAGLAIAATIAAVLFLGSPSTPAALEYIPNDAALVAELRMDLPGDQMQALGNLLANFPGFQDQSTLTEKLDEAFSRLVEQMPDSGLDYNTDIKPLLAGPTFMSIRSFESIESQGAPAEAVIIATTTGTVACDATLKGESLTHETYRGLDLAVASSGVMACAVDGRYLLLGNTVGVKLAIDTHANGTGLDKSARYTAARAGLGQDRLATLYVDGAALKALMPAAAPGAPDISALAGALPEWMIAGLRAESDAMVLDFVAAPIPAPTAGPSLLPVPPAHPSVIAPMLPADTLAMIEVQGAGVGLQNLLTQLREVPEFAAPLDLLEGLGGSSALVGWIDDVGVAVSVHGTAPEAALLLVAKDEATATSTVSSLTTVLGFAGLGDGIDVTEATVNGVQVTTVTITDLNAVIPPGSVPGLDQLPITGPISFGLAAKGRVVLLTFGDPTMTNLLNVAAGSSLVDSAAFKQAAARGLANSRTTMYFAAGATLDLVRGFLPAEQVAQFDADVAPYLDPFEAVLITSSDDSSAIRSRMVITVTKP